MIQVDKSQNSKVKSQNCNSKVKSDLRKRCYIFSLRVIKLTEFLPNKKACWVISGQLIRSATSIGANLVEAKSASSRLEFKKYYEISLKSANESKYWLCLLRDAKFVRPEIIANIYDELNQISNMLGMAVIKLKSKKTFEF
jgi:four helix bundle protein